MEKLCTYEIRVEGQLSECWTAWFDDLSIRSDGDGATLLRGLFIDQAALLGILTKIHALNLTLVSVCRMEVAD